MHLSLRVFLYLRKGRLMRLKHQRASARLRLVGWFSKMMSKTSTLIRSNHESMNLTFRRTVGTLEKPLDFISVWATDLIIDRVSFLVSKDNKEECFNYLVSQYGTPDTVRDMYVWKSSSTTLTFRMNPQRAAIRKKGQGLGVFWRTKDFEKLLQEVQETNP